MTAAEIPAVGFGTVGSRDGDTDMSGILLAEQDLIADREVS